MKYTVLVVDDEKSIRALYQMELEEEGYNVRSAETGAEAFRIINEETVHVVVLDIKLRRESGLHVLQEISRNHPRLPVVLSTAYGAYKDDCSSWLAEGYVVKSTSLDELKVQIANILKRHYGAGESH